MVLHSQNDLFMPLSKTVFFTSFERLFCTKSLPLLLMDFTRYLWRFPCISETQKCQCSVWETQRKSGFTGHVLHFSDQYWPSFFGRSSRLSLARSLIVIPLTTADPSSRNFRCHWPSFSRNIHAIIHLKTCVSMIRRLNLGPNAAE